MKNIIWQNSISERFKFLLEQFQTDLVDNKNVKQILLSCAQKNIFFYEYTDSSLEWSHFSTWWNGMALRTDRYSNRYIHDLYWVHELYHLAHKKVGFESAELWAKNKCDEEFEASVFSEMSIYSLIPGLRNKTFDFPILVDEINYSSIDDLKQYRRAVIAMENPETKSQKLTKDYYRANLDWCKIFLPVAESIESQVQNNLEDHAAGNIELFIEWLKLNSTDHIPFKQQALQFNELKARNESK